MNNRTMLLNKNNRALKNRKNKVMTVQDKNNKK